MANGIKKVTAVEEYKKLNEEANELVAKIKSQIYITGKNFSKDSTNWGYVGSLTDVNKNLRHVLFQLGGMTEEEAEKHGI